MKRFLAMIIILGLFLNFSAPVSYATFEVRDKDYNGLNDGFVSREEAVADFIRAVGFKTIGVNTNVLSRFKDYSKIASGYKRELAAAVSEGIISGYEDGTFKPQALITRVEALVILNRIIGDNSLPRTADNIIFEDTPLWAEEDIERLVVAGIVMGYGDGKLGAKDYLTYEQIETLTNRAARMLGPAGDFYEYVNREWIDETEVPDGQLAWSDIYDINKDLMMEIGEIVYDLYSQKNKDGKEFEKGSSEQKIVDVFAAAVNIIQRDKIGIEPVRKYLEIIEQTNDMKELLVTMAKLERAGFHGLTSMAVGVDAFDSSKYILSYSECYLGMNVDLVQSDNADEVTKAYRKYITDLFSLYDMEKPLERAEAVTKLCAELANNSMPLEKHNAVLDYYHVFDKDALKRIFNNIDISAFLKELGFSENSEVVVYDLRLAKKVDSLFVPENLELLKDYLRASVMDGSSTYLNTDAFMIWRDYQNALNGTDSQALPSDYAISIIDELLGWDLAKLYVEKCAEPEVKEAVERLTKDILKVYQEQVKKNSWMSNSGKNAALKKLENIQIRVGYPENISDYIDNEFKIKSITDGGNLLEYRTDYCIRYFEKGAKLLKGNRTAADIKKWNMLPQTVNAMYEPSSNSITIPAGILKPPFYDVNVRRERNLGGIGTVIAHEISHALDMVGSKFDEKGNLYDWWKAQDENAFERICKKVERSYGNIEVFDDSYINGSLTLSENLADIAGMACILDVAGEGNQRLDELFEGYATIWRMKAAENYVRMMLTTDTHSPDKIRVNRVLSN
ncbi:MAG: S-layer homology domain-containing protein, partial [Clostridia bacterium]|nr:S-layer homology domain-containing protein [Clostridia bacterium]